MANLGLETLQRDRPRMNSATLGCATTRDDAVGRVLATAVSFDPMATASCSGVVPLRNKLE